MSNNLIDKVYIGLENAPAAFDIRTRILGPNGTNLEYIRSETGVVAVLKGDKYEPLHLVLHHTRTEALAAARSLALNLIETIRAELAQWTLAQNAAQAATSVSAPSMTTSSVPQPVPPPAVTSTMTAPPVLSTSTPTMMSPVVSVASATAPLMTVRQPPTVLQLLPPQQQYVLNQENGQLIPIVQQGMQPNSFQSFSHPLGGLQQQNFGTQYVDISGMQPLTQLRLSGVPSSMSMILPNGLTLPSGSWTGATDTTTVSSAMSTPVVCAAQNTNSAQKILYSTDKIDKDTVQWAMPGSQTMIIPYQQLHELAANQAGLANIQQQYVSIPQTSIPLSAAQLQQLQTTGTLMPFNPKPTNGGSLINIISTGQASSPHITPCSTPTKNSSMHNHESRGQKRLNDGSPQLQLRPIAPAGDSVPSSTGMKINPAHGTIIHVSSGQQTTPSTAGVSQDGKMQQPPQNVQMITVPPGMTVLQNPLGIGQMPAVLGQPNSQVYMIPANQSNFVQAGLGPGIISQQVLQPGQNLTVMQPNQLSVPNNLQYSTVPLMSMNMAQNQYLPAGINLNNPLAAQQLNAALANQQLANHNLAVSGSIPIIQSNPPGSPLSNMSQTLSATQTPIQQIIPQNTTYLAPGQTLQNQNLTTQYVMQPNTPTMPYNIQSNQSNIQTSNPSNQSSATSESETTSNSPNPNTNNQNGYITSSSQQAGYALTTTQDQTLSQQTYTPESPSTETAGAPSYTSNGANNQNTTYTLTNQPPSSQPTGTYTTNTSNQSIPIQNAYATSPGQNTSQANYSPSQQTNPVYIPNTGQPYSPSQQGNPYPNATGQNMAAYANAQYQYTPRPWFRAPRFGSPQGSPYHPGNVAPNGAPLPVPAPGGNYNYWQDS